MTITPLEWVLGHDNGTYILWHLPLFLRISLSLNMSRILQHRLYLKPREVRDEVGLRWCCLSFQVSRWRDFNITEARFKELKHTQSQRLFCLEVFVCVTCSCHPKFEILYTTLLYVHIKYMVFQNYCGVEAQTDQGPIIIIHMLFQIIYAI